MASFGKVERSLARVLDNMPAARAAAKKLYQHVNFALKQERGFVMQVADGWSINTPASIAGVAEPGKGTAEFFGYFNISPWSPDQRHFVTHRQSSGQSSVDVGLYDFEKGSYRKIGSSPAWTLQQATLAQWLKDGALSGHLIFNTVVDKTLGAQIVDASGREVRFLPHPIQDVSGKTGMAAGINPLRLPKIGSDYGYELAAANLSPDLSYDEDGLWLVDLENGVRRLVVTLADTIASAPAMEMQGAGRQEINHVQFSPSGNSLVFMHRWYNSQGRRSALLHLDVSTGQFRRVLETGMVSHYSWLDDERLILWCRGLDGADRYHVLDTTTKSLEVVGPAEAHSVGDGHPSCLAAGEFLTDSYPDRARQQHLFTFDPKGGASRRAIGRFLLPLRFTGPSRVDLHPRVSPDRQMISIDSGHTGERRTYILQRNA